MPVDFARRRRSCRPIMLAIAKHRCGDFRLNLIPIDHQILQIVALEWRITVYKTEATPTNQVKIFSRSARHGSIELGLGHVIFFLIKTA